MRPNDLGLRQAERLTKIIITEMKKEYRYKIKNADGAYLNNGTGLQSWFTLEQARKIVNYSIGQRIVEHDGVNDLWEVF
jgi:hypothetical protein